MSIGTRRAPSLWQGDLLKLADLQLHLNTLTLQRQEVTVQLSGREFQLLEYFLRHPRQVLTHEQNWNKHFGSGIYNQIVKQ
ncbi:hypothetical protein AB0758_44865 [Tolypothrix bouteillei VB521301_2]|uniref:hypothetical protein n=1 Tax=Tolypothrix bouteillei TaxID=1246981 RepID=UPI0038B51085